jgi:hypothetical protein
LLSSLVVAGCAAGTGNSTPSASPSTGAPTSAAAGGPVAACVVGNWQTTEASLVAGGPLGNGSVSGGSGVKVKVGATGQTEVDFTGMQPIMFSGTAMGATVKGQFVHTGMAKGQIRTGDATSQSGTWEPVGKADWGEVKVTLELTEPLKAKPFDNLPLASVVDNATNSQTGGVVDVDPLLGKAKYECGTNTLTLTPEDNKGVTWKLTKTTDLDK